MRVNTTGIARYALFPGIWPRIKHLFGSGFALMASMIAVIYHNVGLLPQGHDYLNPRNFGRFGIRHVLMEARHNLVFDRENIDKVLVYFLILGGIVILALQFVLLGLSLASSSAFASALWASYFTTTLAGPEQDMAMVILDKVFGVSQLSGTTVAGGFFESCMSNLTVPCTDIRGNVINSPTSFPTPLHLALHQMLLFYTLGIAFISGAIILYFVVAIVGETIVSGTPFGQRFNKAWFLPRLIMFFFLIAPISFVNNNAGINVAQLITLSAAKYGSNMATNAWTTFVDSAGAATASGGGLAVNGLMGNNRSMVARPNAPEIGGLTQFMHLVRMCIFAEKIVHGKDVLPYIVREPYHAPPFTSPFATPHVVPPPIPRLDGTGSYTYANAGGTTDDFLPYFDGGFYRPFHEAVEFSRYNDVILRFGHYNPPNTLASLLIPDPNDPPGAYDKEWGYVEPTCGELRFEITSLDEFVVGPTPASSTAFPIQDNYWYFIGFYLANTGVTVAGGTLNSPAIDITTYCMLKAILPQAHDGECVTQGYSTTTPVFQYTSDTKWMTVEAARAMIEYMNLWNKVFVTGEAIDWNTYAYNPSFDITANAAQNPNGIDAHLDDPTYSGNMLMTPEMRQRGWAGAALWYNQIASINGMVASAVQNIPRPYRYPRVMEIVADAHKATDKSLSYVDRFNPRLANGQVVDFPKLGDEYIAAALFSSYEFWNSAAIQETVFTRSSSNAIINTINMILGTNGLYSILENEGVYPLAMISALGKSMVDAALRNLFAGIVGQGIGSLLGDKFGGPFAAVAGKFAFRFGMVGLSIGFILFYVVPLLPFLYFFFAFSGWVKSIFEAIVAMPLWALAHIKIDGEGLPGPWATNGYFLIFEIFVRPTLIIFGFIFSIVLFAALVDQLHSSYYLLTLVASGYDIEAEMFGSVAPAATWSSTGGLPGSGRGTLEFMRGPVDELFYTIIYVMIVYMIGISCFKLVDQIPNNILRWMGVTVSTFHESIGDPATELIGKVYRGSQMTNAQILQLIEGAGGRDHVTDNQITMGGGKT